MKFNITYFGMHVISWAECILNTQMLYATDNVVATIHSIS